MFLNCIANKYLTDRSDKNYGNAHNFNGIFIYILLIIFNDVLELKLNFNGDLYLFQQFSNWFTRMISKGFNKGYVLLNYNSYVLENYTQTIQSNICYRCLKFISIFSSHIQVPDLHLHGS